VLAKHGIGSNPQIANDLAEHLKRGFSPSTQ